MNEIKRITLVAYFACSLAYLFTIPYSPYPGSALVKALPIYILLATAWVSLKGPARGYLAAGLLLSSWGDILLELDRFTPGLASFLLAQLCYARYFLSQRETGTLAWGRLAFIAVAMLVVSFPVITNADEMLVPVAIYMGAICLMGIGAALYRRPSTMLFAGAALFVASDSMIGINRFVTPLPASSYLIMISYYAAQLFIVWGVMRSSDIPRA
jgi:uncharacterized membrane protein YhhN